jgi:hypothetical protein
MHAITAGDRFQEVFDFCFVNRFNLSLIKKISYLCRKMQQFKPGWVHAEFIPLIDVSPLACVIDCHFDDSHWLIDFMGRVAASAAGVINRPFRSPGQKLNCCPN